MTALIDTAKVKERRKLRFTSIDDIAAEVERLARCREIKTLGNWSSGQVLQHLAMTMQNSIDGFPSFVPAPIRLFLRLFMKRRILTTPMSAGFKLPANAAEHMLPKPTEWDAAVANFRREMQRLKTQPQRMPHPAFGPLTSAEWEQLHCRHSELHLGFLMPVD
jgi:hypothetical protein